MKIQHTVDQSSGAKSEDVRLSLKSDDELSESDFSLSQEDNSKARSKQKRKKNGRNIKINKVVRVSYPSLKDNEGDFPHHTILGSGTEWTIVDAPAWD
eukprot:5774749-Ditylum_brightwellii.AAC.1